MLRFASSVRGSSRRTLFAKNYSTEIVESMHGSNVSGIIATVFGSTGFTGRYVVSRLGEKGAQIVIPYRGTENVFRHLKVIGDLGQVVPYDCDVWKPEQIEVIFDYSTSIDKVKTNFWVFFLLFFNCFIIKQIFTLSCILGSMCSIKLSYKFNWIKTSYKKLFNG